VDELLRSTEMPVMDELLNSSLFFIEEDTNFDILMDWADCVGSTQFDVQKRKSGPAPENQSDATDSSTDSGSSVPAASAENKCKSKVIKLKDEPINLRCEWRDCNYQSCTLDHFVHHVSLHIPQLEVKMNETQEGTGYIVRSEVLLLS
jgi:hypothetical protein